MVGHDITKGGCSFFSPYRYRGQLYSIIYGQAIPSVIGQKSVALTADINQEYMILESKVEPDNSCSQNIALDILDFQSKINDKLNTCIQNPNNISYISVKTFQRLKGVLYRNGIIAAYVSNTNDYKEAYKLISEENTIINECLNMEIKYLKGQCSKKNLGDWIGRELPEKYNK